MYGGGLGELGVGRGQIQLLASLFHADAPNDVAPSAYNQDDPPGRLPASPLPPHPVATGFRWAGDAESATGPAAHAVSSPSTASTLSKSARRS